MQKLIERNPGAVLGLVVAIMLLSETIINSAAAMLGWP